MRPAVLIALALLRAGCNGPPALTQQATPVSLPTASRDDPLRGLAQKVFRLGNRQRRLHGLHELEWNDALAEQARLQSTNMMERGFFSHIDPLRGALSERLRAAGIKWSRCGENIFREHGMEEPADSGVEGWMKSAAHRQSLLDPLFTQSGVGIAISPDTEYFITQDFIHPPK